MHSVLHKYWYNSLGRLPVVRDTCQLRYSCARQELAGFYLPLDASSSLATITINDVKEKRAPIQSPSSYFATLHKTKQ